ncbi:MFS transporter [Streptacidiphilus sp. PAMC 29251]
MSPEPLPPGPAEPPLSERRLGRARLAVLGVFFSVGLVLSAWFTQIPQFKSSLGLSDGRLGVALLCPAIGALVSMQVAGRLARRHGSASLVRWSLPALAAAMPLLGASRGFLSLAAALLVFGLVDGVLDVSMNAHAVAVETALGRPVLQGMHAAFSLGTIVGAVSGAAAIWGQLSTLVYLSGVGVGAALVWARAAPWLLPPSADREPAPTDGPAPTDQPGAGSGAGSGAAPGGRGRKLRTTGWSRYVIVLGLLGAGCLLAEGAAETWGSVFLRDQRHAAPALASAAYLVFTVAQLGGRMAGDRLHLRLGSVRLVRWGALVAAVGLGVELLAPQLALVIVGIVVYSLGLSVLVPVVFGAVGHSSAADHGAAGTTEAVARFTTLSYLGYLLGPASIGWLAQLTGLTWALSAVLLVLGAVLLLAPRTKDALPPTLLTDSANDTDAGSVPAAASSLAPTEGAAP